MAALLRGLHKPADLLEDPANLAEFGYYGAYVPSRRWLLLRRPWRKGRFYPAVLGYWGETTANTMPHEWVQRIALAPVGDDATVPSVKLALLFAAAAATSIGIATPAHAATDKQIRFMSDVDQHGGLSASQVYNGKITLGDAVCEDIHKGKAANEVIDVANDADALHRSTSKAEVVVYWAIPDLCPDEMSQRQDHWRDGQ